MPGSKRRALKKLLSPHSDAGSPSPAPSSIPSDTALPALDDGGAAALSESAAIGGGGGAASAGASVKSGRSSSLRSSFSLHGRHKPKVAPPPAGAPLQPADSAVSMSSVQSGGSAMSVSEQESLLEEMSSREGTIGTGQHRASDGVPDLNSPSPVGSVPEHATASSPRKKSFGASAGGMYGGNFMQGFGTGGKGKKSSRQRFEERQAKKKQALLDSAPPSDPSWTAQLEKERQEEIQVISDACEVLGREIFEIPPDGHCMYHAVADQLGELGLISPNEATDPRFTRSAAAKYMLAHRDDFMPFLASIDGEDTAAAASHEGLMTEDEFTKYCFNVAETGEWGGEPEIQALSRAFKVPIHVVQRGPPTIVSHGGSNDGFGGGLSAKESLSAGDKVVRISYHRRMYGLGEHYNSLRKA